MADIPPRNPVSDTFFGALLRYTTAYFLATEPHPEAALIARGHFTVRYGVRYVDKPQLAVVPGLLAVDYGDMLTGEDMWTFIRTKNNLYPRADVIGYRNDGEDTMVVLKKLDLAQPFAVLVYGEPEATTPLATINGVLAPENADLPHRLLEYAGQFATLEDWRNRD